MFTLQDVTDSLVHGELDQLDAGNEFTRCGIQSGMKPEEIPRIISFINMGLTNLYTKFTLKTKQLVLEMNSGTVLYHLTPAHAQSSAEGTGDKYILDSADAPFTGDILSLIAVYNACGHEVPIGDLRDCCSVFYPAWNQLQVPNPVDGEQLTLLYRAKAERIPVDAPMDTVIDLPDVLWECLNFYVAGKYYARNQNTQELSNINMVRFANRIAELHREKVFGNQWNTTNVLLDRQGWV